VKIFGQGYHPDFQLDKRHPLFIMMSGVPGLGKSLLANVLARVSNSVRACQDESGSDRVCAFLVLVLFLFVSFGSSSLICLCKAQVCERHPQ